MLTNLPRFAAVTVALAMSLTTSTVSAVPPRSERVANRIVERAYARQSIAEARAAQAEARVAQISPLAPVPPPPRPATVRRMRRAGVPLTPPPVTQSAAIMAAPARRLAPALPPASKPAAPPPVASGLFRLYESLRSTTPCGHDRDHRHEERYRQRRQRRHLQSILCF